MDTQLLKQKKKKFVASPKFIGEELQPQEIAMVTWDLKAIAWKNWKLKKIASKAKDECVLLLQNHLMKKI